MSVSPPRSQIVHVREGPYYLSPFDNLMAPLVATWARDPKELFWLAPKTPPPLTAAKVVAWPGADGRPLLFYRERLPQPLGYLELNPMPGEVQHMWMGHCVLCQEQRGRGLGKTMVRMMLAEAFRNQHAWRVSLVVFPDNAAAISCYTAAGFFPGGEQVKYFHTTGRQHRMLQMTIDRVSYERTAETHA